jgi:hypothetical protein
MKTSNHMNYIALQQNIIGKSLMFGQGAIGKEEIEPIQSKSGLNVFINGQNIIPSHGEILDKKFIGELIHPAAMIGMPDTSGELTYHLCTTNDSYFIVVGLKLDDEVNGNSESCYDLLGIIFKKDLPDSFSNENDLLYDLCEEILFLHFDYLFDCYESIEDIKDWEIPEEGVMNGMIDDWFKNKQKNDEKN